MDKDALALVDSGASYNFISWRLVNKLGWRLHTQAPLEVQLANGDRLASLGAVCRLVQCGKWQAHIYFFGAGFDVRPGIGNAMVNGC